MTPSGYGFNRSGRLGTSTIKAWLFSWLIIGSASSRCAFPVCTASGYRSKVRDDLWNVTRPANERNGSTSSTPPRKTTSAKKNKLQQANEQITTTK